MQQLVGQWHKHCRGEAGGASSISAAACLRGLVAAQTPRDADTSNPRNNCSWFGQCGLQYQCTACASPWIEQPAALGAACEPRGRVHSQGSLTSQSALLHSHGATGRHRNDPRSSWPSVSQHLACLPAHQPAGSCDGFAEAPQAARVASLLAIAQFHAQRTSAE